MLHHASKKWEEVWMLEEEAQQLETEGWGKFREALVGSEAEGFYGLLRGVTSCSHLLLSQPPLQRSHLTPSSSISQLPPQESTGPDASDHRPGHCVCPSSHHSSSRGRHTGPYTIPQNSTGGHQVSIPVPG